MAKEKQRSNKEIKKPKMVKTAAAAPASPFAKTASAAAPPPKRK
jgi:hypothetical protein